MLDDLRRFINKNLYQSTGMQLDEILYKANELPYFKGIGYISQEVQSLLSDYADYDYDPFLGDISNISSQERDALTHFYGSKEVADEYGPTIAHLSGLYHELEGWTKAHAPESIYADLINNTLGINQEEMPIPTVGSYDIIDLLKKYQNDTINENELQILETFIDYGLEASVIPPTHAISGYMPGDKTISEQLFSE